MDDFPLVSAILRKDLLNLCLMDQASVCEAYADWFDDDVDLGVHDTFDAFQDRFINHVMKQPYFGEGGLVHFILEMRVNLEPDDV